MSESEDTAVDKGSETHHENRVVYTLVGAVVGFVIIVLINYIAGMVNLRLLHCNN